MTYPQISIIVPVYNAGRFLDKCITSILSQSFRDFELLLVDDGSKDDSGVLCDLYAQKDARVKVFHKENGGVSSARNLGLDNAKGEWIAFVDSDDTLYSDALQTFMKFVRTDIDCVTAGYVKVDKNDKIIDSQDIKVTEIVSYETMLYRFYVRKYNLFDGYLWNRIYRSSVIKLNHIRFREDIYFKEDGLFVVEFFCASKRLSVITTIPIYRYLVNEEGAMETLKKAFNQKYLTDLDAAILCLKTLRRTVNDRDLICVAKEYTCVIYCRVAKHLCTYQAYNWKGQIGLMVKVLSVLSFPFWISQIGQLILKKLIK